MHRMVADLTRTKALIEPKFEDEYRIRASSHTLKHGNSRLGSDQMKHWNWNILSLCAIGEERNKNGPVAVAPVVSEHGTNRFSRCSKRVGRSRSRTRRRRVWWGEREPEGRRVRERRRSLTIGAGAAVDVSVAVDGDVATTLSATAVCDALAETLAQPMPPASNALARRLVARALPALVRLSCFVLYYSCFSIHTFSFFFVFLVSFCLFWLSLFLISFNLTIPLVRTLVQFNIHVFICYIWQRLHKIMRNCWKNLLLRWLPLILRQATVSVTLPCLLFLFLLVLWSTTFIFMI